MPPPLRFGVAHDFRCPPGAPYTLQDVYAQTFEQLVMLDELGLDLVWFSEHHFVEDGYLPSFVPVAGAAAAITKRMRISTDIALAPFAQFIPKAALAGVLMVTATRMIDVAGIKYHCRATRFDAVIVAATALSASRSAFSLSSLSRSARRSTPSSSAAARSDHG